MVSYHLYIFIESFFISLETIVLMKYLLPRYDENQKYHWVFFTAAMYLLNLVCGYALVWLSPNQDQFAFITFGVSMIETILILFFLKKYFLQVMVPVDIYSCFIGGIYILKHIVIILLQRIGINVNPISYNDLFHVTYLDLFFYIVYMWIEVYMYYLVGKKQPWIEKIEKMSYPFLYLGGCFTEFIIYQLVSNAPELKYDVLTNRTMLLVFILVFLSTFISIGIGIFGKVVQKKKEVKIIHKYTKGYQEYYQEVHQIYIKIRKIRHDLANHLQVSFKDANYLKNIRESINHLKKEVDALSGFEKFEMKSSLLNKISDFTLLMVVIEVASFFIINMDSLQIEESLNYFIMLMNLLIVIGFYLMSRSSEIKKYEMEYKQYVRYQNMLEKSEDDTRQIMNQLVDEMNVMDENASHMLETLDTIMPIYHTGIATLDSLLSYKDYRCRENHIRFDFDVQLSKDFILSDMECISLFANLIDNAIEACEKVEEERYLKVCARMKMGMFYMSVENSSINVDMISRKMSPENHGWGLKIIQSIVEKHHGEIKIKPGKCYKISLILEK